MDYSKLTLREKVLQTFIVTIREVNRHGGPEKFFRDYPVGGMYYSLRPATAGTVELGTGTNPQRLAQCRAASRFPLLICADGCKLPGQSVDPSARAVGAIQTEQAAYSYGRIIGMQMNGNDIDWVLYPVADLLYHRDMPLFAFSDDPAVTAKLCRAIIRGIQDQGVCATAKHFPGIGTCNLNMHFGPGSNRLPLDEWMQTYGYVYRELFQEGVCSVMTTHMTFPAYQNRCENGYYPIATFSHKLTTELLKQELGFSGAVVTDALNMGGAATGDPIEEAVQTFRAGSDLLLWPPVEAADRIVELLQSGEIPMSRLDDALARIERMRQFRERAQCRKDYAVPDAAQVDAMAAQLNRDGLCLLRNALGLLPLGQADGKKILIVDITDESKRASSVLLKEELERRGFAATILRDIYDVASNVCWQEDIDALQEQYDLVILNMDMEYATMWKPQYMLVWAIHMFERKKKIILNYGSAFFADTYLPEEATYIEVNAVATALTVKELVDRMLGLAPWTGKRVLHSKPLIQTDASC